MYHTSVPNDPEVIIKINTSNVFNTTCRVLTLDDVLMLVLTKGQTIPVCGNLSNLFSYLKI